MATGVVTIQIDPTDDGSVEAAAARVRHEYGHLDVLINNAGTAEPRLGMRGALVAALSPISQIASADSQSCRSTVPLPVPIAAVIARPLASWHMLEQSGRLLVPNSRTHNW